MVEKYGKDKYPMMGESQWQKPSHEVESHPDDHEHDDDYHWGYASKPEYESPGEPHGHKYYDESPHAYPKAKYVQYGMTKMMKKKVYDPGYYGPAAMHGKSHCPPIMCDPQYVVRDCYIPREVPVVHPVVTVNRHVIVNVPKHYCQPMTKNVVVDPGCPGCHPPGYHR